MKKILPIIAVLLIVLTAAGRRQHVFYCHYGIFDADTMKVFMWEKDHKSCYKIHKQEAEIIMYCPAKNIYFMTWPTNDEHGNVVAKYEPLTGFCTGNW